MDSTTSTAMISAIDLLNSSKDLAQLNLGYLGISVTILLLMGGVFVYFNIKPLKDSLDAQAAELKENKKDAQETLKSSKEEQEKSLGNFKKSQEEKVLSLLNQESENILLQVENKITAFDRDITEKIDSAAEQKYSKLREVILSEIKSQMGALEKALLEKISSAKSELEKEISSTKTLANAAKQSLKDIERRVKELELEEFSRKNQMGAIYRAIELLKEAIDDNNKYAIPSNLERLHEQVDGIALKADDITQVETQLVRLDSKPEYKILIEKIRAGYSTKNGIRERPSLPDIKNP